MFFTNNDGLHNVVRVFNKKKNQTDAITLTGTKSKYKHLSVQVYEHFLKDCHMNKESFSSAVK